MTAKIPTIDTTGDTGKAQTTVRLKPETIAAIQKAAKARVKQGHKPAVDILLDTDDLVKEQVGGFVNFIREHAIVGLAVGFIIGAQAQAVIKQLVTSFIDPVIKLLVGTSLANAKFTINGADFAWGAMVYVLINLITVLAAIYILIKVLKLDKLDKPAK
jgi:large-conductance mechanosensitive channel